MLSFVYILKLRSTGELGPLFYVGITKDPTERIQQHVTCRGAQWTQRFPFEEVCHMKSFKGKTQGEMEEIENRFTLEVMAERGIECTRGGKWINERLTSSEITEILDRMQPKETICPICGKPKHGTCKFANLAYGEPTRDDAPDDLPKMSRPHDKPSQRIPDQACIKRVFHCSRCGRPGHKITQCRAGTDQQGNTLPPNPATMCLRCGFTSHKTNECRSRFDKQGNELA